VRSAKPDEAFCASGIAYHNVRLTVHQNHLHWQFLEILVTLTLHHDRSPCPSKKSVTPCPQPCTQQKNWSGRPISVIGQGDLSFSSSMTCVSPGTSDEKGWSPWPYLIHGQGDRLQTLVGSTMDPRGFSVTPYPQPCTQQKSWSGRSISVIGRPDPFVHGVRDWFRNLSGTW